MRSVDVDDDDDDDDDDDEVNNNKWSKNFDESVHCRGCIFHGGQFNVTLTSWEHCSWLSFHY